MRGALSQRLMLERRFAPLRSFMLRQTQVKDLALFERLARVRHGDPSRAPADVLLPAFVVGKLRSAFAIGFALYLPFVAIDLAVASILMGLGMFMLSPPIISLPCKLLLCVMVDGWALVYGGVLSSFR
jgi:flagellar biosynthetic protein FliP